MERTEIGPITIVYDPASKTAAVWNREEHRDLYRGQMDEQTLAQITEDLTRIYKEGGADGARQHGAE